MIYEDIHGLPRLMLNCDASRPVFAKVGGSVTFEYGSNAELPLLTFVSGRLAIMENIELPILTVLYGKIVVIRMEILRKLLFKN